MAYLKIVDNKATMTLVVFSSANIPEGKFSGSRVFISTEYNYVFINTVKNDWYVDGIQGLGDSFEEAADSLKNLINRLGSERVIFYGGSMGGYGAALYGSVINPDFALSLGTESLLGIKGGFFNKHCNSSVVKRDVKKHQSKALKLFEKTKNKDNFIFYFGEMCSSDLVCALKLREIGYKKIYTIPNENHALPPLFHEKYDLMEMVSLLFESSESPNLPPERIKGDLLDYPCLCEKLYKNDIGEGEEDAFRVHVFSVKSPISRSYALFKLATDHKRRKEFDLFGQYLEEAVRLNGSNPVFSYNYSDFLSGKKRYAEAVTYAEHALQFRIQGVQPLYNASISLVNALIGLGKRHEAGDELDDLKNRLTAGAKSNPHISHRLDVIERRLVTLTSQ